ncbi:MAG: YchJ family protein [Spirochaetaceae bacterium]|nr:YchJ family protein [Spirochaetaceae bacterium]
MDSCPCGSGRTYEDCCGPYISGTAKPSTASALMRARYTAYTSKEIDFIVATCLRDDEHGIDIDSTRRWSERSKWLGLRIVKTDKGAASDKEGTVEFIATYVMDGLRENHHEISSFVRGSDGEWLFSEGEVIPETVVREGPKVGRNESCPCGSGKKFKKCCGAASS